jgi:hypothetical protein
LPRVSASPRQTQSSKLDEVIESFSFLAKDVYVTATVNEETSDMFLNMHVRAGPPLITPGAVDGVADIPPPSADVRLELYAFRKLARLCSAADPVGRP